MTRIRFSVIALPLFVPLLMAGLLLAPPQARAQVAVDGPATPAARALTAWVGQHVPAKFQARERLEVQPLGSPAMDDYLHNGDSQDGSKDAPDDDGDIDGVFANDPPQITLRIPSDGQPDMYTFAHEYGH